MSTLGSFISIYRCRNFPCRMHGHYNLLDKTRMKYTFRPRNDIRIQKAFLRSAKLIAGFRPDLEERIKIYFIDLGTEFGFTRKHMIKLFQKRIKHVETET
jgi:hypothetical protein